jgi:hypothetical protein
MKKTINLLFAIILSVACAKASPPEQNINTTKWNDGYIVRNELAQIAGSVKQEAKKNFDFEKYTANQLPSDWSQYYTGSGGTDWKIKNDNANKVLAQLYNDNPNGHFNIVVNNELIAKNMELSVRLKGVTGKHDQGGGFIWRFIDKNNYYVVRANPLEDNVVLYKVKDGKRSDLPLVGKGKTYGISVDKLGNGWNTLKLKVEDNLFTVFLNEKELFKVQDNTFPNAGKVGFWTKADAVTFFDDFKITTF